jgi:amino-acid N-acetyltransferase
MTVTASTTASTNATIRQATDADLPAIERLLTESALPLEGVRDALKDFVVAESHGRIVGVAGLEICSDSALLRSVAVSPDWRGRSVGRALVTRAIADAEARGVRGLYLLTTTAEDYFPSFGFAKIARENIPADVRATTEFTTTCSASATAMSRALRG